MILTDNINFLLKFDRSIREDLKVYEEESVTNSFVKVVESKKGLPTIQVTQEGRQLFIHSKYDPQKEAERLVAQYEDQMDQYQHVFFYGVGMGYHVEAFLSKYPDIMFTIYEPNPEIFQLYLSHKKIEALPVKNLKNLFVETSAEKTNRFLTKISNYVNKNILLVTLPSYERIFADQSKHFLQKFKESIKNKRSSVHTDLAFEKRWTINSMMNFSEVLKTPNILRDVDKKHFEGKPAILVSAGPSLNEEIENLRHVKKNGLAYIFSVGSAINTLIDHDIYPDVMCTYDPKERNQLVFKQVVEKKINSIPMIFGSSVGFETLQNYAGPKAHMLTSQDTVAPFFLRKTDDERFDVINDSSSIAVITLQLLGKLGINPIIFVGQNLAFKNGLRYSSGNDFKIHSRNISEEERTSAILVEGAEGNQVATNDTFNRMRLQLEIYTAAIKQQNIAIINTTKDGAKIQGTEFKTLETVIERRLKVPVVVQDWHKLSNQYNYDHVLQRKENMDVQLDSLVRTMSELRNFLKRINELVKKRKTLELHDQFERWDKEFKKLKNNDFFKIFILPSVRVQHENMTRKIATVKFLSDGVEKGNEIVQIFSSFLFECYDVLQVNEKIYVKMKQLIEQY
jgi:hypothetical protein